MAKLGIACLFILASLASGKDFSNYKGLKINDDKSIVSLGKSGDIKLYRKAPGIVSFTSKVEVEKDLSVQGDIFVMNKNNKLESLSDYIDARATQIANKVILEFQKSRKEVVTCQKGWTGPMCTVKDACINKDCGGPSKCKLITGGFRCICAPGWQRGGDNKVCVHNQIAVTYCNNGRNCNTAGKGVSWKNAGCSGTHESGLMDGIIDGQEFRACDCTKYRADHPCVDRAHIYRHHKKVTQGSMLVYGDGGCIGSGSSIGFSVDGEKWVQVQISTFLKKNWQKVFRVDKSIWGTKLGLKEWQYFYYAQGCGGLKLYEIKYDPADASQRPQMAVTYCNNGRDCHKTGKGVSWKKSGCKGKVEHGMLDGVVSGQGYTACDCTKYRADHPCVDRAHIYRHPKKVDRGTMYVYADGGCIGTGSSIGFSADGENWKEAQISTFVKKFESVLIVDESVWRLKLGLTSWQYFYYAQGCGGLKLYEIKYVPEPRLPEIAVGYCNNGRECHGQSLKWSTAKCKAPTELKLLDGIVESQGYTACDCTAYRKDHPCVDRAHMYKHPRKVKTGAIEVYAEGGCVGSGSSVGFSVDGNTWKQVYISKFMSGSSWSGRMVVGQAVWGNVLKMKEWQYFYYAQGCGGLKLQEIKYVGAAVTVRPQVAVDFCNNGVSCTSQKLSWSKAGCRNHKNGLLDGVISGQGYSACQCTAYRKDHPCVDRGFMYRHPQPVTKGAMVLYADGGCFRSGSIGFSTDGETWKEMHLKSLMNSDKNWGGSLVIDEAKWKQKMGVQKWQYFYYGQGCGGFKFYEMRYENT